MENVVFPIERPLLAITYTCDGFLINENPPKRTEKYKLIAGLRFNDVILVMHNDDTNMLEAVELIQNIHLGYIELMFPKYLDFTLQ